MNEFWNNTCILINNNGEVIESDPKLRGHNEAISYCAKKVGLDIVPEQSMVNMLEELVNINCIILLNGGRMNDENGESKRTGYLALPSLFSEKQEEKIENLKLLLDEYVAILVWKLEENRLKTKSIGNSQYAISIIQEMLDELKNKEDNNLKK